MPALLRLMPAGSAAVSLNVGAGKPLALTWKLNDLATVAVALAALVNDGG